MMLSSIFEGLHRLNHRVKLSYLSVMVKMFFMEDGGDPGDEDE